MSFDKVGALITLVLAGAAIGFGVTDRNWPEVCWAGIASIWLARVALGNLK